ncbi:MAG: type II/IV secretion system protein [Verrucomicrobiae bacterium]|nr:type II/IV secretion system protein [Verrucomicrobiae bacterium]MCP5541887.1 type II/IV secretion system protein [Akkermansiaceae bacterium]
MSLVPLFTKIALESGCTDRPRCEAALSEASEKHAPLIDAVLDAEVVEESAFAENIAKATGLEFLAESELDLSQPLHSRFPAKLALRHRLLPGRMNGKDICLMTYDPFDLEAKQAVGRDLHKNVTWAVSTRYHIMEGLRRGYGVGAEHFDELIEGRDQVGDDDDLAQEVTLLDEEDEEASVMNFVNQVFREALKERATDIHIEPLENNLRIRYRIDGALQEVTVPPNIRALQASLISRLKIMAQLDIAERRLPQDGRINLQLDGEPIDVRVATIPSVNGESVSLRLLTRQKFDMSMLGLDPPLEAKIREFLGMPNGIILVTGPTGSGKSTTLYTFLKQLNTKDTRIVTIEDPVENKLDGVIQIAVKPEIGLTFAAGLRSILRGDPNIIMIGEMRDLETTEIAVRGALTGHLVFSTLHTNDAVGGITRLLDMGVEPFLIASSVRAFLAQRLVRTLCEACKRPHSEVDEAYLARIGFPLEHQAGIHEAVGCRACRGTGYRGRMAIVELCSVTPAVQELITANASYAKLREQALRDGMVLLRHYGWQKVAEGRTTLEEVLTNTAATE